MVVGSRRGKNNWRSGEWASPGVRACEEPGLAEILVIVVSWMFGAILAVSVAALVVAWMVFLSGGIRFS
jgi:hypothetical protein